MDGNERHKVGYTTTIAKDELNIYRRPTLLYSNEETFGPIAMVSVSGIMSLVSVVTMPRDRASEQSLAWWRCKKPARKGETQDLIAKIQIDGRQES